MKKKKILRKPSHVKKAQKKATATDDIIQMILSDHKPLKKLIEVLKNEDAKLDAKKEAFNEFSSLLILHSKPEEQILYSFLKDNNDLRVDGFEGEVEHALAEQIIEDIKRTNSEDLWCAKAKILAELVEHHIEEEEEDILPMFRKNSNAENRYELGREFLLAKEFFKDREKLSEYVEEIHIY